MRSNHSLVIAAFIAAASLAAAGAYAQAPVDHSKMDHGKAAETKPDPSRELTDGEIRKVDKDAGKITIKHGEIRNLDMPAMTMVFQVTDRALLDKVQVGDKVRFKAQSDNGKLMVSEIQAVKP